MKNVIKTIALFVFAMMVPEISVADPSSNIAASHTESNNKEKQLVEKVVLFYVCIDEDVLCENGIFKGHVDVIKIVGKYAKVHVLPDGEVDPEWVYLKKGKTGWDVLDSGTGVNPMELGIPKEAW